MREIFALVFSHYAGGVLAVAAGLLAAVVGWFSATDFETGNTVRFPAGSAMLAAVLIGGGLAAIFWW